MPNINDRLPDLHLLAHGEDPVVAEAPEVIAQIRRKLQETLDISGIAGRVSGYVSGPRITRYEVTLEPGVRLSRITRIEKKIETALETENMRLLTPIPGRNCVGIEIPNARFGAVSLRSMMESDAWRNAAMELPIILGRNVAGRPVLLDLARAPHLLIAGATGSGKSVFLHTFIMSLLFRFSPEHLRMLIIDPKTVEMGVYKTLPHLIAPVITDAEKVPIALRRVVDEMERRYRMMALAGVRNLRGYNTQQRPQPPLFEGEPLPERLPFLVIVINELADMMCSPATRAETEMLISRITAQARAAGIHLAAATSRPDNKVITATLKGNFPTRIAFKVVSAADSRVILDRVGAEDLLGRGDMLFSPPYSPDLERVQGAIADDPDIEKVVGSVSAQAVS